MEFNEKLKMIRIHLGFTQDQLAEALGLTAAALGGAAVVVGFPVPTVTAAQAQAAVDFMNDNGIETIDDLQNLDPNVEIPAELQDLFDSFTGSETTA